MTLDEVRALMATCDNQPPGLRDRLAMTLALTTALRSSNVVFCQWGDIKGRRLHVVQKGQRPHEPVLDDRTLEALEHWGDWIESQGAARRGRIFRRVRLNVSDEYDLGTPIKSRVWFNQMLVKRAGLAGIRRKIHPHLFRHSFVSWALAAGVSPARVMAQTGHRSMAVLSGYATDLEADSDPIGAYLPEFG
jgi:integrase